MLRAPLAQYWRNNATQTRVQLLSHDEHTVQLLTDSGFQYGYDLVQFLREYVPWPQ